ncbi:hypothetical protein E2C01_081704 [Portunus trituberculatus]|uniref:Uncharacterized protein n=1 Tax=Portunus trituberculatus TaxID=210409 RepID=A0A5B7IZK5_PORTR|nr:hypothetical protein [Portunus trituberculatus]
MAEDMEAGSAPGMSMMAVLGVETDLAAAVVVAVVLPGLLLPPLTLPALGPLLLHLPFPNGTLSCGASYSSPVLLPSDEFL